MLIAQLIVQIIIAAALVFICILLMDIHEKTEYIRQCISVMKG